MNTLDQIVQKHNLSESFISAKPMDSENRIFKSDHFIIKIYYPRKYSYYYNELVVYQNLYMKDYLSKLYFYGEEQDYKYIIISRLEGQLLFDLWDNSSLKCRDFIIEQLATILKDINHIKTQNKNFKSFIDLKFNNALSKLDYSDVFLESIQETYASYRKNIQDNELCYLIHDDLHFYNFMLDNQKLLAYDFEHLTIAPLDYQLVRFYKQWKYPETLIYPKYSMTKQQKQSYQMIMPSLLKYYPQLIQNCNVNERLKLYLLIYLLEEAKRVNLSEDKTKNLIKENKHLDLGVIKNV
jgi:hypothetical protein